MLLNLFLSSSSLNLYFVYIFSEYIEQDLVDFASSNPSVVVYLKPRRHRSPVVVAEYCKY